MLDSTILTPYVLAWIRTHWNIADWNMHFPWWGPARCRILMVIGVVAMVTAHPGPVLANGANPCSGEVTASLSASPAALIRPGDSTTLNWNVQWRPGCQPTSMHLYYRDFTTGVLIGTDVTGRTVGPNGTVVDHPQSSGSYFVRASVNGWPMDLGSGKVSVALPLDMNGKTTVDITQPNQSGLF